MSGNQILCKSNKSHLTQTCRQTAGQTNNNNNNNQFNQFIANLNISHRKFVFSLASCIVPWVEPSGATRQNVGDFDTSITLNVVYIFLDLRKSLVNCKLCYILSFQHNKIRCRCLNVSEFQNCHLRFTPEFCTQCAAGRVSKGQAKTKTESKTSK